MSGTYTSVVYYEDFTTLGASTTAGVLNPLWDVYNSVGNAGFGFRRPAQVSVVSEATAWTPNVLQIVAQNVGGQHHSGGLQLNYPLTYGQYELRVRVADDASAVTSGVVLLWPADNNWPAGGEIDWWESFDNRTTRTPVKSFVHRANPVGGADELVVEHAHTGVDQSDWHKIVCNWAPDELAISIDDGPFVPLTTDPANIPDWPMQLAIQLDAWSNTPPAAPVVMQVDYVVIRAWEPAPQVAPFPAGRLDLRVEMAFGADLAKPLEWVWTDVTDRLDAQVIPIQRGRADESGNLAPSSITLELTNHDGHLTPGNGASPWWPNVRRGTPLRITVDGATPALRIPGGSTATAPVGYASTPDHASLDITGDIDLRARLEPEAWANGITWDTGQPAIDQIQRIISKYATPNDRSWMWSIYGAGWPLFEWSTDGTGSTAGIAKTLGLATSSKPIWLAMTMDVDNGAGGTTAKFYTWPYEVPPADINEWVLVGTATQTGTTSLFAGTAPVYVGMRPGAIPGYRGRIHAVEIRAGINGTVVANPYFSAQAPGTTSFTDGAGRPWTLTGVAEISTRTTRFAGYIDEIELLWPYGDNDPAGSTECRVAITASDIVRRLNQGNQPIRSSFYRGITSARRADAVGAYWPFEDSDGAVEVSAGIPTHDAIQTAGLQLGADSSLRGSAPLAKSDGGTATWRGAIPASATTSTDFVVDFVAKVPELQAAPLVGGIVSIRTDGDAAWWNLLVNTSSIDLDVWDSTGSTLLATDTVGISSEIAGNWILWRLEAHVGGGVINWSHTWVRLDTGTGATRTGTIGGGLTLGNAYLIDTVATHPKGISIGHLVVSYNLPTGWLIGVDTAWVGEAAAHRIWRLGSEDNVPMEVTGDLVAALGASGRTRGDLSGSEPLGPQQRAALTSVMASAAAVDLGMLHTRRSAPGLAYRTRQTIEHQPLIALALDARNNEIVLPLRPKLDDQRLRNAVTISSTDGSEGTYIDTASVTAEGLYQTRDTINGVGGVAIQPAILGSNPGLTGAQLTQNHDHAAWRAALGAWPGLRYPGITIDLGIAPHLLPAIHTLELGDRITLAGLPAQHPAEAIELIVEAIDEQLSPTNWLVTLTCSPGGPWLIGRLA